MKTFMQFFKRITVKKILYPIISICVFLGIWAIIAAAVGMKIILPSPLDGIKELFALLGTSAFWLAVSNTLLKVLLSFGISAIAAIFFASLCGVFPIINRFISPIITILRAVPTMSIILLAIIWFNARTAPVFVAFLIIFPTLYSAFYSAIDTVDRKLIEMGNSFGIGRRAIIMKIYLPTIAPSIFDGLKNGISLTVKLTIAAEVLSQTKNSMGVNMQLAQVYLDTVALMGWTIAAVFLCFVLESIIVIIKKCVVRWK